MMEERDEDEEILFEQSGLVTRVVKPSENQQWCRKFINNIALCSAFLALGLCIAIPGPTLLDLQDQLHTDTEHMTIMFTARSVGYLLGSIIGGVLFDFFNHRLLLMITLFFSGIATIVIPWTLTLIMLLAFMIFQGITLGMLDTGGNIFCISVWRKKSGPYIQMLHFTFGIGAFIAPLLATPFLSSEYSLANSSLSLTLPGSHQIPDFSIIKSILDKSDGVVNKSHIVKREADNSNLTDSTTSKTDLQTTISSYLSTTALKTTAGVKKSKKPTNTDGTGLSKDTADGSNLKDVSHVHLDGNKKDNGDSEGKDQMTSTTLNHSNSDNITSTSSSLHTSLISDSSILSNLTSAPVPTQTVLSTSPEATKSTTSSSSSVTTVTSTTPRTIAQTTPTTTPKPTTSATTTSTVITTTTTTTPAPTTTTIRPTKSTSTTSAVVLLNTTLSPFKDNVVFSKTTAFGSNSRINGTDSVITNPVTTSTETNPHKKPSQTIGDILNSALLSLRHMTKIQFVYLTIGLFLFFNSFIFCILYCHARRHPDFRASDREHELQRQAGNKGFRILILTSLFFFLFLYMGMEVTFGGLIMTFAVEYLHWEKTKGAVVTAIFWGSLALGRGISIFVAKCCKPPFMLSFNMALVVIGALLLTFGIQPYEQVLWAGVLVFGLGVSSVFPTGLSWAEHYISLTGKATSIIVVGSALGQMVLPLATGYFYETFEKMALMYMMLAVSVVLTVLYIVMQNIASNRGKLYSVNSGFMPLHSDDADLELDTVDVSSESNALLHNVRNHTTKKHQNGYSYNQLDDFPLLEEDQAV